MTGFQVAAPTAAPGSAQAATTMLRVELPGGPHAVYRHPGVSGEPHLAEVIYPPERWPADRCAVIDSLEGGSEAAPLGALLLGNFSHPAGSRVEARPLGVLRLGSETGAQAYLVAVATADDHFAGVHTVEALPPARRQGLEVFVRLMAGACAEVTWGSAEAAQALVQDARQRWRLARAAERDLGRLEPAWKPLAAGDQAGSDARREAERHTASEYAFHRLPHRFQQYVEASLTADERILFSVPRPLMHSSLRRGSLWGVRRQRLEAGVLVVTDRQVAQVVELMPPDSAGIRYGFIDRTAAPERLAGVEVVALSDSVVGLAAAWAAAGGQERVVWEFPASHQRQLEQAAELLAGWLPQAGDRRLRRAAPPAPPETWPPLRDPGANDPADVLPVAERLLAALAQTLCAQEVVLARCLLPAWLEPNRPARLAAVTTRRFLVVRDPAAGERDSLAVNLPVAAVSSLEFTSTLVGSHLKLMIPTETGVEAVTIRFTSTVAGMDLCYHTLRRLLGVVKVSALDEVKS